MVSRPYVTVLAAVAFSCGPTQQEPGDFEAWPALVRPSDRSAEPDTLEVDLVAQQVQVHMGIEPTRLHRTYGGSIPGPLLRARKGDRVIVHFENQLHEPTTIHWHGVRVPNGMDGVPGVTQPVVGPGERFEYDFIVPDAGLFWYHPHYRTLAQVGDGMYGAILVEDPDEPEGLGVETVIVLSDMSPEAETEAEAPGAETLLLGREGAPLVNGRRHPELRVAAGSRQRFRIVNAARSRYFQLVLEGSTFTRIGGDVGFLRQPEAVQEPQIAPGERADLIFEPQGMPGARLPLKTRAVARGPAAAAGAADELLMTLVLTDGGTPVSSPLPSTTQRLEPPELTDAEIVELALTISSDRDEVVMGINGVPHDRLEPIRAKVGSAQIWNIVNQSGYSHPFHLHGFRFQVLGDPKIAYEPSEYKDTVHVSPVHSVRIAPHFDDRPGLWMFHCHILDHAAAGMMGMVEVER